MAGLKYVGAPASTDNNPQDVLTKLDVDTLINASPASQTAVSSQINTQVATLASTTYVNNALAAYTQPAYVANQEAALLPTAQVGVPSGVTPLDSSGVIPPSFMPSLGIGYCLGPFGTTAIFSGSTGSTPFKIADWAIGPPNISFQPMVFLSLLVGAIKGGRPIVEVRMSAGPASYANQTLVARAVGRNNWNDKQALTALAAPSAAGHTGVAGTAFAPTYNLWLSAWMFDANSQTVSLTSTDIANAGVFLIRPAL